MKIKPEDVNGLLVPWFPKYLMYLFKTSEVTVINTILTWINYMYIKLGSLCIWPNASQVKGNMPNSIKEKFPNAKCIIDCVELKIAVPLP